MPKALEISRMCIFHYFNFFSILLKHLPQISVSPNDQVSNFNRSSIFSQAIFKRKLGHSVIQKFEANVSKVWKKMHDNIEILIR